MANAIPVNTDTDAPPPKAPKAGANIPADVLDAIKDQIKAELKAETGLRVVATEPVKEHPHTYKVIGHNATCTDN